MTEVALQPMLVPLVLMAIVAPLAAVDELYFHLWKFRLYREPSAFGETIAHIVRASLFSFGAFMLATYRFGGMWFWIIGGLFVADFLNNLVDVVLERRSRARWGGLPTTEYAIHIIGSTFAGAIAAAFLITGWDGRLSATALVRVEGTLPSWLIWQGRLMAIGGAVLALSQLSLLLGSSMRPVKEARA